MTLVRLLTFGAVSVGAAFTLSAPAGAQAADPARLTVERIFSRELSVAPVPRPAWSRTGSSYIDVRPTKDGGSELVRFDIATGKETVLARADQLASGGRELKVEELSLSGDEGLALLFHNSVPVWRNNTRGVFDIYDFKTGTLRPVSTKTGLQMFAKVSPDGRKVAFVRDNDLFVSDLATGHERRLTTDGTADVINGTTDWVYEEELGLRDAFRWSPDSKQIAFYRFDQSAVPVMPIVNELGLYPKVGTLRYPKAGAANARVRLGVIELGTDRRTWLDVGPDTGQYFARMEWVGADSLAVQRLPRKQNSVDVMLLSATSGRGRTVMTDRDSAYVDSHTGDLRWIGDGQRQFLWLSDRSGWRQLFLFGRDGKLIRQLTTDGVDIVSVLGVDQANGYVYVSAAAPTPTQRNVYRVKLGGGAMERVTKEPGSHVFDLSPDGRYAVDSYSTINAPPTATLYALPSMRVIRVLQDNAALKAKVAQLSIKPATFIKVPMPDGTTLDAFRMVPANFDSTRKYPVLMYVYGGPASPLVNDAWGGTRPLWLQSLAQQGYVVICADNRGAAWRGRDFRKTTQYRLGLKESDDQMNVARWIGRQSWGDASRIGIWGWSYGGYLSSLTAARGGDLFKAAIVVSPVTDWDLYDSIYTERYMWTPQQNAEGYKVSAPLSYVAGVKARLLLVHGTGDDNVHPQNTIQLADKLEAANKPFYMLLYPNRTHSISGGNTSVHLFNSLTRFVLENL
jgi:dipeptidyl-peptidase-4